MNEDYRIDLTAAPRRLTLDEVVDELVLGWSTQELVTQPVLANPVAAARGAAEVWRDQTRTHVVHHPPLLDQLDGSLSERTDDAGGGGRSAGPRVIVNVEAMALLQRLSEEAAAWLKAAERPVPLHLKPRLRAVALAGPVLRDVRDGRDRSVEAAAWSWRAAARVLAAWDAASWRPRAVCPNTECDRWNGLRVRGMSIADGEALCTACQETWTGARFVELAAWVAWSTVHLLGPEHLIRDASGTGGAALVRCRECLQVRDGMADRDEVRRALQRRSPAADPPCLDAEVDRAKRRTAEQIQGDQGVDIVRRLLPIHWVVRELNPDYGLDLHVEVFEPAGGASGSADTLGEHFFMQVKTVQTFSVKSRTVYGRMNVAKYEATPPAGDSVSIDIIPYSLDTAEIKTIEVMGTAVPVLLVVVAVSTGEARYICLNDWISKVLLPDHPDYHLQKSVTVHVPAWNVLDSKRVDFTSIRLLARRSKFYAAFSGFAYQYHELQIAAELAEISASMGLSWVEAAEKEGVLGMLRVFLRGALRLGIWAETGGGTWPPLAVAKDAFVRTQALLESLDGSELQVQALIRVALEAFRQADLLGRIYEEMCREWRLPTMLASLIEDAETRERASSASTEPGDATTAP